MSGGECLECGEAWDQHPTRYVECPSCGADEGSPCRRPSGWACSPHAARWDAAIEELCPLDDCLADSDGQTTLSGVADD